MANNYTETSFAVPFVDEPREAAWLATPLDGLDPQADWWLGQTDNEHDAPPFEYEIEDHALIIYGDLDIEATIAFVRRFLAENARTDAVIASFCYRCTRPRVDEFGGFAVVITARDETWYDAANMARAHAEQGPAAAKPRVYDYATGLDRLADITSSRDQS